MRAFERRATNAYPYFKLASWDSRNLVWRDGKKAFPTEKAARAAAASAPGRYRISVVTDVGRTDLVPFEV
jgi:hypothetical protein